MAIKSTVSAIYFDTSILRKAGWPTLSSRIRQLIVLASKLEIAAVLLDPVKEELEKHRMREYKEAITKQKVVDLLAALAPAKQIEFPAAAEVLSDYRQIVEKTIADASLGQGSVTSRNLQEVFSMATSYEIPFKPNGEGAGFQDTVILLSAIDHARAVSVKRILFVTSDGFVNAAPLNLAAQNSLEIIAFDSIEALLTNLEDIWKSSEKSVWERANETARSAAESILPQIQDYLDTHLVLPDRLYGFGGKIIEIKEYKAKQVVSATTPIHKPKMHEIVTFTADVEVTVLAGIEPDFPFLALLGPKEIRKGNKQGAASATLRQGKASILYGDPSWAVQTPKQVLREVTVLVEIAATVTETGYVNLKPVAAQVRTGWSADL
jgi:hypothetical protein